MKCVICKHGETQAGSATVTLECDGLTLVVKSVPAEICQNCGEEYLDERVTDDLLQRASEAARLGVRVEVRDYVAA
ncbi:MAG: type II toxin-antitoxin system MqsA family antitoxin [Planctomycetaceae bacterium]